MSQSRAEAAIEEITVRLTPESVADLRRTALTLGLESASALARQAIWHYLYGYGYGIVSLRPEDASQDTTEPARYPRRPVPPKLRLAVFQRDGHRCVSCGATAGERALHADHKIPVAKGGETTLENLQTLCEDCNIGKGTNIVEFPGAAKAT